MRNLELVEMEQIQGEGFFDGFCAGFAFGSTAVGVASWAGLVTIGSIPLAGQIAIGGLAVACAGNFLYNAAQ